MRLISLTGAAVTRFNPDISIFLKGSSYGGGMRLRNLANDESEPLYEGYQIWVHANIPDYTDLDKAAIQTKFRIINYAI